MSYKIDIPRMSIPFAFHSYMSIKETITALQPTVQSNHNTVTNHSKDVLFRHTAVFPIPSPSTAGTHCPRATCITQRKCRARPLSKRKKTTRERRTEPRAARCCEPLSPGSFPFQCCGHQPYSQNKWLKFHINSLLKLTSHYHSYYVTQHVILTGPRSKVCTNLAKDYVELLPPVAIYRVQTKHSHNHWDMNITTSLKTNNNLVKLC